MIPKIIHYCWFGKRPKSPLALKCIESWKKFCPDYEIIEWNEDNFDLKYNKYVSEAYASKKWAFVTDVVRLYALVNYGGIYMDTDVEVIRPLDRFLEHSAFSGFESQTRIPTGIMACEKNCPLFEELLHGYDDDSFILPDGSMNMVTNVIRITDCVCKYGLKLDGNFQIVKGFALYPKDWFCAKNLDTLEFEITENTHTIHNFAGSWITPKDKFVKFLKHKLGVGFVTKLVKAKRLLFREK